MHVLKIFSVLSLVFVATQSNAIGDKKKWYSCANNSDCAVADFLCGNEKAVNRDYLGDYNEWLHSTETKCQGGKKKPARAEKAICQKKVCKLVFKSQSNGKR